MRNAIRVASLLGILSLSSCGSGGKEPIFYVPKNSPSKKYTIKNDSKTTILFDREGDGSIDQILKVNRDLEGLSQLPSVDKRDATYLVIEGTNPDQYIIANITPQIMSALDKSIADQTINILYR